MYARARNGGSSFEVIDQDVADHDFAQYHFYRIEWDTTETRYYVDNILGTTIYTEASPLPGYIFLHHPDPAEVYNVAPMHLDWVRGGEYPATGSYVSCVQDVGAVVNFRSVDALMSIPDGSNLTIETRTSTDGVNWSDYAFASGGIVASPDGRYLQYRLVFSSNTMASAELQQLIFYFGSGLVANAGGPYAGVETISFNLSGSGSDPEGLALSYSWDLDNDGIFEKPGQIVSLSFPDNGIYPVRLRVSNPHNESAISATTIDVSNTDPSITKVTVSSTHLWEGDSTAITVIATDPAGEKDPLFYAVDCNNAGFGLLQSSNVLSCTYLSAGTFLARVTVDDRDGGIAIYENILVDVLEPERIYLPFLKKP